MGLLSKILNIKKGEFLPIFSSKLIQDHFSLLCSTTIQNNIGGNWIRTNIQKLIDDELKNISAIARDKMNNSLKDKERHSSALLFDDFFISISTFPCSIGEAKRKYYKDGYFPYMNKMINMGRDENPRCHWLHFQFFWDGSRYWTQLTIFPNKEYLNFNPMYILPPELLSQKEKLESGLT